MKKLLIKLFDKIILLILGFSGILYACAKYGMPQPAPKYGIIPAYGVAQSEYMRSGGVNNSATDERIDLEQQ